MKRTQRLSRVVVMLLVATALAGWASAQGQQPKVQIPQPGVPQIMTLEGRYVRAAYNNEGYVILGYQLANRSVGQEWMYIEIGATLRDGVKDFTLPRANVSLSTPDGKTIPMATQPEYQKADLRGLEQQATIVRDSINYFPPSATRACRIGFFAEVGGGQSWDQVDLANTRACVGRIFFHVPGGIAYGQHWLNVKLRDTLVRVPFRILTKDEQQFLDKNYKDIEKQVEEAFKPKKK